MFCQCAKAILTVVDKVFVTTSAGWRCSHYYHLLLKHMEATASLFSVQSGLKTIAVRLRQ